MAGLVRTGEDSKRAGYTLCHHQSGRYISTTDQTFSDGNHIGSVPTATVLTITYTGNQTPKQSGSTSALSFYRINSPDNGDQQIRARVFGYDWIWGSGTLTRADMIFTFREVVTPVPTPVSTALGTASSTAPHYYTLQGIPLSHRPLHGLFIEKSTTPDGHNVVRKIMIP